MNIHDFAGLRNISNREVYHGADQLRLVACELCDPRTGLLEVEEVPLGAARSCPRLFLRAGVR
jgi:hypothetical protein